MDTEPLLETDLRAENARLRQEVEQHRDLISQIETKFRGIEAALQEAAQEAQAASQAKSHFLANISHEIRTPLGVILGFADLALDSKDPTEVVSYLQGIKRNAQLLSQIVGDVLDFSKIEAKKIEIEKVRISLEKFLCETRSHMELKARQKGLNFQIVREGLLPDTMETDPVRLHQILLNLIGNAIKFTEKGTIELAVKPVHSLESGKPMRLEFRVRDTGIGIAPEHHRQLFQPFMQVDPTLTRKFGGTGLGLMLSRQIARALGGELKLMESAPGLGTTFGVDIEAGIFNGRLLLAPKTTTASGAVSGPPAPDLKSRKILVAEDSPDNQVLIRHYLRSTGAEVVFAANGQEALQQAEKSPFDLVLMDLQMPVMDGYEATRSLRETGFQNPIVAVTAHALREEKEKALQSGFNGYLTKPLTRQTLYEFIVRLGL